MTSRPIRICLTLLLVLALLAGGGCIAAADDYVKADRAAYESIGVDYVQYVEADPKLTPSQKQLRKDNVAAWRIRIKNAGGFAQ